MTVEFKKIAIIGMGLMGGSIAKRMKEKDPSIEIGSLTSANSDLLLARSTEVIDQLFSNWDTLALWADLVVLAVPLSAVVPIAKTIATLAPKKELIVIDIGSVKEEITAVFETLTADKVEFVATHPMAGKENWGFAHSASELFIDAPWIITPHLKNRRSTLQHICELISFLGGSPVEMQAQEHDRQVALISHLPALISQALLSFVATQGKESLKIAGPGFQSMTRLAHDNPDLYRDIYQMNQKNIRIFWEKWIAFLQQELKL